MHYTLYQSSIVYMQHKPTGTYNKYNLICHLLLTGNLVYWYMTVYLQLNITLYTGIYCNTTKYLLLTGTLVYWYDCVPTTQHYLVYWYLL